ncbi:MAG: DUF3368 domain-containing protein [Lewinellaceae bacterium]|nr:DUF3368 domain-containing protein [Lewinellaceae bacterium]
MIVISDTSPITNLIQIGKLEILKELFHEIIIPEEVYEELCELEFQRSLLNSLDWIKTREVADKQLVNRLIRDIDKGEAESIVLAIELKADILLIDEKKGRRVAREYGLEITGLLGILKRAKSKNLIPKLQPVIEELILKGGFRIHPRLYEEVLKSVGE